MSRKFAVTTSCHQMSAIEACDLTLAECQLLRRIVANNWTETADYKAKQGANPFLQGYAEPGAGNHDGWCLVEFWSYDAAAIQRYVDHVNQAFREEEEKGKERHDAAGR